MHKKSKICLFYLYTTAKSEIQICLNKRETDLVPTFNVLVNAFYIVLFCFVLFDYLRPINNISVKQGWVFLG